MLRRLVPFVLLFSVAGFGQNSTSNAEKQRNLSVCLNGYGYCDHSLLGPDDAARVANAEKQRNLSVCLNGYGYCDHSLLGPDDAARVANAESRSVAPSSTGVPGVAENGSYYGQLNAKGVPKTVHVDGYYRKDGTYVRGHYRSPPYSNPPKAKSH